MQSKKLNEIDDLINKFQDEQKEGIIRYYLRLSEEYLAGEKFTVNRARPDIVFRITNREIGLLARIMKYLPEENVIALREVLKGEEKEKDGKEKDGKRRDKKRMESEQPGSKAGESDERKKELDAVEDKGNEGEQSGSKAGESDERKKELDVVEDKATSTDSNKKNEQPRSDEKVKYELNIDRATTRENRNLIDRTLSIYIKQMQTFILNHFTDDLFGNKKQFSKVSKWMEAVVKDIRETFGIKSKEGLSEDLLFLLNVLDWKFCNLMALMFFSNEEFKSGGNQLLIDLYFYRKILGSVVGKQRINKTIEKAKKRFSENTLFDEAELLSYI